MQEKREKIRYLDNIRYMFQNWAKWNSKSFLYLVVWVPALIVVPMLGAYVPKAMIDSIEAGVSIPQLVLKITLISGGIAAASWIGPFMQQKMQGAAQIIRMRYAVMAFNKLMTCDYVDVESLAGRERFERSRRFTDNDGMPYSSYFCIVVCQLAVAVFGLLTSAALLVKLPVLMLVLILAASAAEFFVFLQEFRYDEKVGTKISQFYVRLNYFYRTSHDFFAGKDVRLYGLDLSENMLRTAKEKLGDDADLTIGDAEALPFEDGTFDLLLCNDSFHHYPAPDKVLMEFMRVLKPEGTLLLSDYCMAFPLRQLMNVFIRFSDDGDVRIYSEKEITGLLQAAGFRDIIYGRTDKTGCVIVCRKTSDRFGNAQ